MRPLNRQQQRFVEEYLVDLNGTQAAIRAGYSAKTANPAAAKPDQNPRRGGSLISSTVCFHAENDLT